MKFLILSVAVIGCLAGPAGAAEKPGASGVAPPDATAAAPSGVQPHEAVSKALEALKSREDAAVQLHEAIVEYFGLRLSRMPHAVWIGDTRSQKTAFVFVDYSAPFAFQFLHAVDQFASKEKVRCIVLAGSLDARQASAANVATGAAIAGWYPQLFEKGVAAGAAYDGDPAKLLAGEEQKQSLARAAEVEALDQVALARLVLRDLGAKHPTMLQMNGRIYVGSLVDPEEMSAFFAERSAGAEGSVKALDKESRGER